MFIFVGLILQPLAYTTAPDFPGDDGLPSAFDGDVLDEDALRAARVEALEG